MRRDMVCLSRNALRAPSREVMHGVRFVLVLLAVALPVAAVAGECTAAEREAYLVEVRDDIIASWRVSGMYKPFSCTVLIKQNFRGEVERVGIGKCGDDASAHRSVINAGYRASPMPLPDNRACFSRDLIVTLKFTPIGG